MNIQRSLNQKGVLDEFASGRVDTAVWMHYLDANKKAGEEAWRQLHKNVESNIK